MGKTMNKFKLNTASGRIGRCGIAGRSELDFTLLSATEENKPALIAAIRAELEKAAAKVAELEAENQRRPALRGTRHGRSWGAKYNRAWQKESVLQGALRHLGVQS